MQLRSHDHVLFRSSLKTSDLHYGIEFSNVECSRRLMISENIINVQIKEYGN